MTQTVKNFTEPSYLEKLCKIGKYLACNPFYLFEKYKMTHQRINRIYAILVWLILASNMIFSSIRRHNNRNFGYTTAHIILDFMNEFCSIMLMGSCVASTIWQRKSWMKFISKFLWIEMKLYDSNKTRGRKNRFFEDVYFQTCLLFLVYNIFNFFHWMGWLKGLYFNFVFRDIAYFYEFFIEFFVLRVTLDFKNKYKTLGSLLKLTTNQSRKLVQIVEKNPKNPIRKFEQLARTMATLIKLFNRVFGWPLAFIVMRSIAQILGTAIHVLVDSQKPDFSFTRKFLISKLLVTLLMTVCTCVTVWGSDRMAQEGKKLVPLCYKLQEDLPDHSSTRLELRRLGRYIGQDLPKISAAGFFDIDRNTILSIIGTVTTYYIVVIQFNLIN